MENENIVETRLDFTIKDQAERVALVDKICKEYEAQNRTPSQTYLKAMADYCLKMDCKKEYKDKSIITKNRAATIYKREVSYEQITMNLPEGEDGIINLITDNPKNIYLTNRNKITEEDWDEIEGLAEIKETIDNTKKQIETAEGKKLFELKCILNDLYQQAYLIKTLKEEKNIGLINVSKKMNAFKDLRISGDLFYDEDAGMVYSTDLINFANPDHVAAVLHNYSHIRQETEDMLNSDIKWMVWDLDALIEKYVKNQKPIWYSILIHKIDGMSNDEIVVELQREFSTTLSKNSISTIWCKYLPKLIAEGADKENTYFYWVRNNLPMKECKQCGNAYPVHSLFFHRNAKTADGYCSKCKDCRNKNNRGE